MGQKMFIKLEDVLAALPGCVYWKDKQGVYLGCNDQTAQLAGFSDSADIIGRTDYELPWSTEADDLRHNDMAIMKSGKPLIFKETVSIQKESYSYLSSKSPLRDKEGNIIGILGTSVNIPEKIDEKKHRESDFITNISKDIRTPLHAILGTAELLKIKQHLPEQEQYIQTIAQSGESLLKLVENILDFTKLEKERIVFPEEPIDLLQLIHRAMATIHQQAEEKGLEVTLNYGSHVPRKILSNMDALSRVLTNLLSNAVKFTDQGHIIISVETVNEGDENNLLNITVKDTGIGIPQHELKTLFDSFYRPNPSYKGKYKGLGLGLAITKKLVECLKGMISVESYPGVGSQFICTLPCTPLQENAIRIEKSRQKKTAVLLVEDVPLIQQFSIDILETLGCKVTLANDGQEALKLIDNPFDMILMDIGLPDEDGLNVVRKIRADSRNQKTPIIALTAHATDEVKKDSLAAGANDFLAKPASYKMLLNCLSKYTE